MTVYLTAGEAERTIDKTQDRAYFAASRQEGERAAYAAMVGVPNEPGPGIGLLWPSEMAIWWRSILSWPRAASEAYLHELTGRRR